mmetsp:Transcript_20519/g.55166  ORF Transcript_20519/g.55166 Transcript_20519/m.55166 type:complete len:206 (-) Transcript_20519:318-935(-)
MPPSGDDGVRSTSFCSRCCARAEAPASRLSATDCDAAGWPARVALSATAASATARSRWRVARWSCSHHVHAPDDTSDVSARNSSRKVPAGMCQVMRLRSWSAVVSAESVSWKASIRSAYSAVPLTRFSSTLPRPVRLQLASTDAPTPPGRTQNASCVAPPPLDSAWMPAFDAGPNLQSGVPCVASGCSTNVELSTVGTLSATSRR